MLDRNAVIGELKKPRKKRADWWNTYNYPIVLDDEEARKLGFNLETGWLLDVKKQAGTPDADFGFINPEGQEFDFSDLLEPGETLADLGYAPEEETPIKPLEGQQWVGEFGGVEIFPPVQTDITTSLQKLYPELLQPGVASWGFTKEELPQEALKSLKKFAKEHPEDFIRDLLPRGGAEDTTAFLTEMGFSSTQVAQIFQSRELQGQADNLAKQVFPGFDYSGVTELAQTDPDKFVDRIRTGGRTKEKQDLLLSLGLSWNQINSVFRIQNIVAEVEGIRKLLTVDTVSRRAYDNLGNWVGTWNEVTHAFEPMPVESRQKDILDAARLAFTQLGHQSKQFFISTLPNVLYRDLTDVERRIYGDDWANQVNFNNKMLRDDFRRVAGRANIEHEEWLTKHPELQPRPEWRKGATEDASVLKDPAYWAYEFASTAPFTLATMGTMIAGTALGGPALGIAAGIAVMTPSQASEMEQMMIEYGAPEDRAALMGLGVGTFMSLIETAGDLPMFRMIAPKLFGAFRKNITQEVGRATIKGLAKKGLKTFGVVELTETMEEVAQQAVQNAALRTVNENQDIFQGLDETIIKTLIATTPLALVGGGVAIRPQVREAVTSGIGNLPSGLKEFIVSEEGAITPGGKVPERPLVNPHASAIKQDAQKRAQQAWDKKYGKIKKPEEVTPKITPVPGSLYKELPLRTEVPSFGEEGAIPSPILEDVKKAGRRRIIEARIKRGEPVPDNLLAEFPDLAAKAPAVPPVAKVEPEAKVTPEVTRAQEWVTLSHQDKRDISQVNFYPNETQAQRGADALKRKHAFYETRVVQERKGVYRVQYRKSAKTLEEEAQAAIPKAEAGIPRPFTQLVDVVESPKGPFAVFLRNLSDIISDEANFTTAGNIKPKAQIQFVTDLVEALDKKVIDRAEAMGLLEEYINHPLIEQGRADEFIKMWRGKPELLPIKKAAPMSEEELVSFFSETRRVAVEAVKPPIEAPVAQKVPTGEVVREPLPESEKKPLPALPELTAAEIEANKAIPGEPTLTPALANNILALFGKYIENPDTKTAWELTGELRRETRSRQAENLKVRTQELIIEKGMSAEAAMKQAIQEKLSGELPVIKTEYFEGLTQKMKDLLFYKVAIKMKDYPFEMASTFTALTNAVSGKAIPRDKGKGSVLFPKGGSAWDRLNYVFGEQPEVMKAIDKIAEQEKPLKDVVEGFYYEAGKEPVPMDEKTLAYLRGLKDIPFEVPYLPATIEAKKPLVSPVGGKRFEQPFVLRAALEMKTPEQIAQETLELRLELATKPQPPAPMEAPIEKSFKQGEMWTSGEKQMLVRVLKEIGWSPVDIGNFVRANKASFDQSFLRQGKVLASGHPVIGFRAHTAAWQSMFSQKHAEAEWQRITQDPDFELYEHLRLDRDADPLRIPAFANEKGTAQWRRAEEYGFPTVERLIPRLTMKLPHVKYSERGFTAGTNRIVWALWKQKLQIERRYAERVASGEVILKPGEAVDLVKEMGDFQAMEADAIQRASLGKFKEAAPLFSAMFFAARSKLGRFFFPRHLLGITVYKGKVGFNPRIMKEAWRDFAMMNVFFGGLMLLGEWLRLWDVEKDPRNAEFMSARIGNLRIDPWAGYRQFAVLYARLVTGTGVSSVTGAEYEVNKLGALQNFFRGSLSPFMSTLLDFWTGRNFLGAVVEVTNARQWIERVAPFSVVDVWEAFEEGIKEGVISIVPAIYGEGVQTYTGDWKENFPKMGLPKYIENTAYGITEPKYDVKDFWKDTASQFKGVDPATLTKEKGFPPYIKAIAEARVILEHLDTLPDEKLVSLNTDPTKGTTFAQYYQMWLDRQKLVDAGAKAELTRKEVQPDGTYKSVTYKGEKAVTAFDEDNKKANLGNFSQRQFALLNEYWTITDKKKQADFLKEHEAEIGTNARLDYLKSHPKENAQLAVWGQAKVLSQDAYNEAQRLIKALDIPDTAVADYLPPKEVAKANFDYLDAVEKFGGTSVQARFIRTDDKLNEWLGLARIDEDVKGLELKVKNYDKTKEYEAFSDKDSPDYKDDVIKDEDGKTARDKAQETFKTNNLAWVEDSDRIDARSVGTRDKPTPDATVEKWVEIKRISREKLGVQAEEKVWFIDNPDIHEFALTNKLMDDDGSKWNEPVLRIQVKPENRKMEAEREKLKGDEEALKKLMATKEGIAYQDDQNRIEAYQNEGTDFVEQWVERGQKVREFNAHSAEDKIWLVDNETVFRWALEKKLLTENSDEWNIPALRITVAFRAQDKEYNALPEGKERANYLADNPAYRIARRQREAYTARSKEGKNFTTDEIPKYVNYYELPGKGFRRERFLVEDPVFARAMHDIMGIDIPDKSKVPSIRYDEIYEANQAQFDKLWGLSDVKSPHHVVNENRREQVRREMRFTNGKLNTFGKTELQLEAYSKFIPEKHVNDYVGYYTFEREGKPRNWELNAGTDLYYEDDWFLMEHPKFYQEVYVGLLKNQRKDYRKVPSREVFNKYLKMLRLTPGEDRDLYREKNLDLDQWLVLKFGYKPIREKIEEKKMAKTSLARKKLWETTEKWRETEIEIEKMLVRR